MTRTSDIGEATLWAVTRVFGAVAVALGLLMNVSTTAKAQVACTTHDELTMQLDKKFAERPKGLGIAGNGGLVELFSSSDGTTWTVVITSPNGRSCVVMSGEAWQDVRQVAEGPEV